MIQEANWSAIREGLIQNPKNYTLYVLLGEYYLPKNPNQAYLCLENALFYCDNAEDAAIIRACMNDLKRSGMLTVRNTSFIILSYNLLDDTRSCIESIRETVPECAREIVVVDNASTDGSIEWLRLQPDVILRENKTNSGFPKGCNEGIELASKENDIFLLNNDTVMMPNALFWLRMGLYESEQHGATGSIANRVANGQQINFTEPSLQNFQAYALANNIPTDSPYEEKLYLVGFAWLIKRTVFDELGPLDERFSPGNYEDFDYGIRILKAGYKNILCKNSFIIHWGSRSFKKDQSAFNQLLATNQKKLEDKWGLSYERDFCLHTESLQLFENITPTTRILDIGCGCGGTLIMLQRKFGSFEAYGVEPNPSAADIAASFFPVYCQNIDTLELPLEKHSFDYVILNDTLACVQNPAALLLQAKEYLKENGSLIVSVPNIKHFSVVLPLLIENRFTYGTSGILNTAYVHHYTKTELNALLTEAGFHIETFGYSTLDMPNEGKEKIIDMLLQFSFSKDKTDYLAYKYILRAKKQE